MIVGGRATLALALAAALAGPPAASLAREDAALDVLAWPGMEADRLGCLMERALGHRDPRFNCGQRGYSHGGNPCRPDDAYYDGPTFPQDRAAQVSPLLQRIDLAYEGGRVQSVTLVLQRRLPQEEIRRGLALPAPTAPLPRNVAAVSIQGCRQDPRGGPDVCGVILVEGVAHRDAAEADCGAEGEREDPTPLAPPPPEPASPEPASPRAPTSPGRLPPAELASR